MSVEVDLHLHTTFSDGTFTPAEIVRKAICRGLKTIAITDHDTTDGLAVSRENADLYGVNLIPGIEIGTKLNTDEIHILGYYVEENDVEFQRVLKAHRDDRLTRGERIIRILNELGYNVSWERVLQIASGGSVGRPHIAHALVERGYAKDVKNAFEKLIGPEGPAYVERWLMTPEEAIRLLVQNGAVPVLAHPFKSPFKAGRKGISNLEEIIPILISHGLAGIEVHYGDYGDAQVNKLLKLAELHNIVATGGSDYHGVGGKGEPQMGQRGPESSVVADLENIRRK